MRLHQRPQPPPDQHPVMRLFRRPPARDETRPDRSQISVRQRAHDHKTTGLRLAGLANAIKNLALIDARCPWKSHDRSMADSYNSCPNARPAIGNGSGIVLVAVPLVLQLGTLRQKPLATLATTAIDDAATRFRGHTGTETVLVLAGTLGRLESAEAHGWDLGC